MNALLLIAFLPTVLAVSPNPDDSLLNPKNARVDLGLGLELGTVAPLAHRVQFSKNGSEIDYVREGGQDNLFFFARLGADLDIGARHTVVLVYQPLDLRTQAVFEKDKLIDDGLFKAGEPVDLRYGFDFYRASYLYDLQPGEKREFALGGSFQIRNAAIEFTTADGKMRRINHNIGPVPILKIRARQPLGEQAWWGLEADGFYAPIKYMNGSGNDVVGAILDASIRAGMPLKNGGETFLNLRYLGGGGEGTSTSDDGPGDGYVSNWLHLATLSLGLSLR